MLPWALNRTRSVPAARDGAEWDSHPFHRAASSSASVSHRPRAVVKAKSLGFVWLRAGRCSLPTRRSAAGRSGSLAARRLLRFRSARSPSGDRDRSQESPRGASPVCRADTPKGTDGHRWTSRGTSTVPVRFTRRCSVSGSPRPLRRAVTAQRAAPKGWHRWFERFTPAGPEGRCTGPGVRHRPLTPEGAVSSVRHSSAHPGGWCDPNPSLVPRRGSGRAACTRRCEARGSNLTSSELEGAGLRPDRRRLHSERPGSESEDQDPLSDPKVEEPTLARQERGCGRAAPPGGGRSATSTEVPVPNRAEARPGRPVPKRRSHSIRTRRSGPGSPTGGPVR